jgi:hypothetical protein
MFPFVALQADKRLDVPRNTNMPLFFRQCVIFKDYDCQIIMCITACMHMHIDTKTKKTFTFVTHSAVCNFVGNVYIHSVP